MLFHFFLIWVVSGGSHEKDRWRALKNDVLMRGEGDDRNKSEKCAYPTNRMCRKEREEEYTKRTISSN